MLAISVSISNTMDFKQLPSRQLGYMLQRVTTADRNQRMSPMKPYSWLHISAYGFMWGPQASHYRTRTSAYGTRVRFPLESKHLPTDLFKVL